MSCYLKRVLGVHRSSRNRIVYQIVGGETFVEYLKKTYSLPSTLEYERYIDAMDMKFAQIDPKFYRIPVMVNGEWRGPMQKRRHVWTRQGVHGFHHLVCSNLCFHEPNVDCICKYCNLVCDQYHFTDCFNNPTSIMEAALA